MSFISNLEKNTGNTVPSVAAWYKQYICEKVPELSRKEMKRLAERYMRESCICLYGTPKQPQVEEGNVREVPSDNIQADKVSKDKRFIGAYSLPNVPNYGGVNHYYNATRSGAEYYTNIVVQRAIKFAIPAGLFSREECYQVKQLYDYYFIDEDRREVHTNGIREIFAKKIPKIEKGAKNNLGAFVDEIVYESKAKDAEPHYSNLESISDLRKINAFNVLVFVCNYLQIRNLYLECTPDEDLQAFTECVQRLAIDDTIKLILSDRCDYLSLGYYESIKVAFRSEAIKLINAHFGHELYSDRVSFIDLIASIRNSSHDKPYNISLLEEVSYLVKYESRSFSYKSSSNLRGLWLFHKYEILPIMRLAIAKHGEAYDYQKILEDVHFLANQLVQFYIGQFNLVEKHEDNKWVYNKYPEEYAEHYLKLIKYFGVECKGTDLESLKTQCIHSYTRDKS